MAKALSRTVSIYINGQEVQASLQQIKAEIKKLQNEQAKLPIGTEEYIQKSLELKKLQGIIQDQKVAVNGLDDAWRGACEKLANFSNIIMGIQTVFQMGDAAIGSLKDLAADAAALDDVYADVMKTTGLTKEQVLQLNDSFKHMDTRTSREQLNQLAYEAGKLGINSQEAVQQFVSASDKINIALGDVLGEGAMVEIGKLTNIYESVSDTLDGKNLEQKMLAIGSAVNSLGQASTANEGYMVDFMKRMGGIAAQAGLSADQVLGFASALDQNGQAVEMSATATMKLIQQMVKKPEEFVHAAGVSIEEFRRMMDEDMNGAMLRVLEGMNNDGGFQQLVSMFADMGLDGARAATVVSALAKHIDQVREAQALANREMLSGTSVINEFNVKNGTMQAQAEKAKKAFNDMRIELGQELYPVIIKFQKSGTILLKGLAGIVQLLNENKALLIPIAGLILAAAKAKLVDVASSFSLKKAIDIVTLARIRENREIAKETRENAKLNASRASDLVLRIKERIEIQNETIAREREAAAQGKANSLAKAESKMRSLNTALIKAEKIETEAAAAAKRSFGYAIKALPLGWFATALGLAIRAYSKMTEETRKTKKAINEIGAAEEKERLSLLELFNAMQKAGVGSEIYKKAMIELNEKYPDLMKNLVDEKGNLIDIKNAYIEVANAAKLSMYERLKDEKINEKRSEIAETTYKIRDKAYKFATKALKGNNLLVEQYMSLFDKLDGTKDNLESVLGELQKTFGRNKDYYSVRGNSLYRYITDSALELGKLVSFEQELNKKFPTPKLLSLPNDAEGSDDLDTDNSHSIIPNPDQAKKDLDNWKSVKSSAESLINEFRNKALTGAEELYASIDARTNDMKTKINEAIGASDQEKNEMVKNLDEAANAYKRAKLDEYLDKYRSELQKAAADPSGNELIDKINQVAESLRPYDEKIRQLKADQQALADTDKEAAARIAALIQQYEQLKTALADRAYLAIDTSVDTSDFALTGDRFADDKKYNEYTQAIERSRAAATRLLEVTTDPAQRAELEAQIEDLGLQQQNLDNIYKGFDDFEKKIKKSKALDNFINSFQTFGDKALEIFGSINQILDNISNRELRKQEELKDQNIKLLDDQLSQQLISQETYDQRKAAIDEEYSAKQKEIELEQWKRQKALNIGQATMQGALAVLKALASAPPPANGVLAAISAALAATQIAAIASEPEPYAHGGYVNADTVFRAGEAGSEWIAPHRLLTDPVTAPVIQSLEDYRRGRVSMAAVNMPAVNAASSYLQDHNIDKQLSLLNSQFSLLSKYLSDPRNRQAVISRRTMETFDANENFLRSQAKL